MKILFKIYPQKSHYNSTFGLAKELIKRGHGISFLVPECFVQYVEQQGIPTIVEGVDLLPFTQSDMAKKVPFISRLRHLLNWPIPEVETATIHSALTTGFETVLADYKPDLFVVDSPYTIFSLSFDNRKISFVIIESMVNLNRGPNTPPLDSFFVPKNTWWSYAFCDLSWRRYKLKTRMKNRWRREIEFNRCLLKKLIGEKREIWKHVNFDRYFHIGINSVPEMVLSPPQLDFSEHISKNQYYIGEGSRITRIENGNDDKDIEKEVRHAKRDGAKVVVCSLGSTPWRFPRANQLLEKIIAACSGCHWTLIIATGPLSEGYKYTAHTNIIYSEYLPQQEMLKYADLLITTGGINSIVESLIMGVPLLLYPQSKDVDQPGNCARIVGKGLGICRKWSSVGTGQIRSDIRILLEDSSFRSRCADWRDSYFAKAADKSGTDVFIETVHEKYPTLNTRETEKSHQPEELSVR